MLRGDGALPLPFVRLQCESRASKGLTKMGGDELIAALHVVGVIGETVAMAHGTGEGNPLVVEPLPQRPGGDGRVLMAIGVEKDMGESGAGRFPVALPIVFVVGGHRRAIQLLAGLAEAPGQVFHFLHQALLDHVIVPMQPQTPGFAIESLLAHVPLYQTLAFVVVHGRQPLLGGVVIESPGPVLEKLQQGRVVDHNPGGIRLLRSAHPALYHKKQYP